MLELLQHATLVIIARLVLRLNQSVRLEVIARHHLQRPRVRAGIRALLDRQHRPEHVGLHQQMV
jgi:hypothetical protein